MGEPADARQGSRPLEVDLFNNKIQALTIPLPLLAGLGGVALIIDAVISWREPSGRGLSFGLTVASIALVAVGGVLTKLRSRSRSPRTSCACRFTIEPIKPARWHHVQWIRA
jgi:hypothetical protein